MDRTAPPPHNTTSTVPGDAARATDPYMGAPDLDTELRALTAAPATTPGVPAQTHASGRTTAQRLAHRTLLLRRAAAADRKQLRDGTITDTALAAAAARRLLAWDQMMPALDPPLTTHRGPVPPDDARWRQPGAERFYVRQEYPAWLTRARDHRP